MKYLPAIAAIALAACPCPDSLPPPTAQPQPCDLPRWVDKGDCRPNQCGTNSPDINRFPVNGLHAGGCRNADADGLNPTLDLTETRCPSMASPIMAVVAATNGGYALEATVAGPEPKPHCGGADLVGASFTVQTRRHGPLPLRIAHVIEMPPPGPARWGYLITPRDAPDWDPKRPLAAPSSVCGGVPENAYGAGSAQPPHDVLTDWSGSGTAAPVTAATAETVDAGDYVIVLPGPVYNRKAENLTGPKDVGWFNLACAGDGLARTDLTGLIPPYPTLNGATTDGGSGGNAGNTTDRTTALHMLTGRYKDGISATIRGMALAWAWRKSGDPLDPTKKLEAIWDVNGAQCIRHLRLWRSHRLLPGIAMWEADFVKLLAPKQCAETETGGGLTSYVVDHINDAP